MHQNELNDIINACKTNDSVAQERLYKHYFALMYSICKQHTEDKQTIVSIINEGFFKIFVNIRNFDSSKGSFEGWAKKIVTNTAIDFSRSAKNKNQVLIEINENHDGEKALHHLPHNHAEEEVLYLIKKLPAVTQNVFSLHIFKGYSHKEISKMLGIAESTSRWHVAEARKNLKQQLHKIY